MNMNNNDYMDRHKRILSIVSHLGLNKRRKGMILQRRPSQLLSPTHSTQGEQEDILQVARKRLKPIKLKKALVEQKMMDEVDNKFELLKYEEEADENSAYKHIQRSLQKIEEQQIMGYAFIDVKKRNFSFQQEPFPDIQVQPIKEQNLFEKRYKQLKAVPKSMVDIKIKLDDILNKTKQYSFDQRMSMTTFNSLKTQNKLIQQRTSSYFQY
ncbi:hypothetical protein pb186bvf_018394 [Paramecium bursaria]